MATKWNEKEHTFSGNDGDDYLQYQEPRTKGKELSDVEYGMTAKIRADLRQHGREKEKDRESKRGREK